jgi:hypothetical protein
MGERERAAQGAGSALSSAAAIAAGFWAGSEAALLEVVVEQRPQINHRLAVGRERRDAEIKPAKRTSHPVARTGTKVGSTIPMIPWRSVSPKRGSGCSARA